MGPPSVGKTSIIKQYVEGSFLLNGVKANTGAANSEKLELLEVNGVARKMKMDIWDTAGQEVFRAEGKQFY